MDGGGTNNCVSKEIVRKLDLQSLKHPTPYSISWFQDDHWLQVREKCLVNFIIGPFKDTNLCDVVDMSACHVLLERPSQFDTGVVHECRNNIVIVEKYGRQFGLIPLKDEGDGKENNLSIFNTFNLKVTKYIVKVVADNKQSNLRVEIKDRNLLIR